MLTMAGFPSQSGAYFLPRAQERPPEALIRKVFPWANEWEERFFERTRLKSYEQGGLDDDDIAGRNFLDLIKTCREVILQDCACLAVNFPSLPIFDDPLFQHDLWPAYAKLVQNYVLNKDEPRSVLLERALPELSNTIYSSRDTVLSALQKHNIELAARLERIEGNQECFMNGTVTMSIRQGNRGNLVPDTSFVNGPLPAFVSGPSQLAIEDVSSPPRMSTLTAVPAPIPHAKPPQLQYIERKCKTVPMLWREWTEGIGAPSIQSLDVEQNHHWRSSPQMRTWYCRRKVIIDEIKYHINRGHTTIAAIETLEQMRGVGSINALEKRVRAERKLRGGMSFGGVI